MTRMAGCECASQPPYAHGNRNAELMVFEIADMVKDYLNDHNEPEKTMHEQVALARATSEKGWRASYACVRARECARARVNPC